MVKAYIAPEEQTFGISLFDRLKNKIDVTDFHENVRIEQVVASIKGNLARILNTRMNSAQSIPSLGLMDFNDNALSSSNIALQLQSNIQECILSFEPRLTGVSVRALSNEATPALLNFAIEAELNSQSLHASVQFQLMIDKNQQYRVL